MHQKRLAAGLRADPLGELTALPQTPSCFKGAASRQGGEEREGKGREGKEKERKGEGRRGGKGGREGKGGKGPTVLPLAPTKGSSLDPRQHPLAIVRHPHFRIPV
jgi:hypothetical protein